MFKFLLIYEEATMYSREIPRIISMLEMIKNRWGVHYDSRNAETMSESSIEGLRAQIRAITPQMRGRIVSSGGNILPLSHSKRLNVVNTPILLLFADETPLQVYPHMLGKAYIAVEEGLKRILEKGPEDIGEDKGLLEEPLRRMLSGNPSMLEEGASCLGVEVDVDVGVADLLLRGKDGHYIVVEVKNHADDLAVGQVSRIAKGYGDKRGVDIRNIRRAIACVTYSKNLVEACRGANVELYKIGLFRAG